jgi:hypothetical protein
MRILEGLFNYFKIIKKIYMRNSDQVLNVLNL